MNQDSELKECQEILGPLCVGFSIKDVKSKSRDSDLVRVRAYIAVILRKKGLTLKDIGIIIGGRTHATVINLLKYEGHKQCRDNPEYRKNTKEIIRKLNQKSVISEIQYLEQQINKLKKKL